MAGINIADFTHTFATFHHCSLCGSEISLAATSRRGEGWKAVAQELKHPAPSVPRVAQPLVAPGFCSHTFDGEAARVVHSACWKVVAKLWGKSTYTIAEIDGFLDCARNLAPFLPEIPFRESPEQLDVTIDHRLDAKDLDYRPADPKEPALKYWIELQDGIEEEGIDPPSLLRIRNFDLPEDLDRFVANALRKASEVQKSSDRATRFWAKVVGMLANSPATQFSASSHDRVALVAQAMKNLRIGGVSLFPHAANFDIVRANALKILVTLIPIPVEDLQEAEPKDGMRAKLERPRSIPLADIRPTTPFRLNFHTIRRQYFVDNMNDRGFKLGMKYLRNIEFDEQQGSPNDMLPTIHSLSGVRLIRDRLGVLAVHAKDGPNWVGIWQQDPSLTLHPQMAVKPTTAEWPEGFKQGALVVIADVSGLMMCSCCSDFVRCRADCDSRLPRIWRYSTNTRSISSKRGFRNLNNRFPTADIKQRTAARAG